MTEAIVLPTKVIPSVRSQLNLDEEIAYAIFNEGAFINKDRIQTCSVQSLKEAKGSISTKYWENHEWEKLKLNLERLL